MGTNSVKGKRRNSASSPRPDLDPHLVPPKLTIFAAHTPHDSTSFFSLLSGSRRKRFLVYTIAFATMLALSSILDDRRAIFKQRRSKVQLVLPSGSSFSSISESENSADNILGPLTDPAQADPSQKRIPNAIAPSKPLQNPKEPVAADQVSDVALPPSYPTEDFPLKSTDVNLSEQELKDDVDQLIAHVDQEATIDANAAIANSSLFYPANGTARSDPVHSSSSLLNEPASNSRDSSAGVSPSASLDSATTKNDATSATNATLSTESEVRLNSEEHFNSAQKRLEQIIADEQSKVYLDETDLLTLHALSLQATRGDCEHKSGAEGGSLFKTDAEAASNLDIERTDPLWGAWCLFMGSYKTDAMRDFVTKQRVVEEKVMTAISSNNTALNATIAHFDPNAASLDDVMTPDEQSALRMQTDTILAHLQDHDIRYLAALSLQATYGDCGPYGKELETQLKESTEGTELRKLVDPLLGQSVVRRQGAQWGAWCVMQGKKRIVAASELVQRVSLLNDQLTKSQADNSSTGGNGPGSISSEITSRTSSHLTDIQ